MSSRYRPAQVGAALTAPVSGLRLAVDDLGHEKLRGPPADRQPEPRRLRSVFAVALEVATLACERAGANGRAEPPAEKLGDLVIGPASDRIRLGSACRLAPIRIADARIRRQEDNPCSSKVSRPPLRYLPVTLGHVPGRRRPGYAGE